MQNFEGDNILIVDDEDSNIFLLKGLLQQNKYKTTTAHNGEECLAIIGNELPDLVLLDVMMPKMTGLEVLQKLQQDQRTRDIPVIMVTAKTSASDVEEALKQGAIDYIKKPIEEIELLARIKVALRLKHNEDHLKDMIRAKDDFVGLIAHDLRSPFTTIHGFAEMILTDETLSEDQKEAVNFIIEATNYSVDYFNKLLNWTKLGAQEITLQKSNINLQKLIVSTIKIFENKAQEKNISLIHTIEDNQEIHADETYFRQVMSNLINNAIKFTPNGGQIEVKCISDGSNKQIHVIDNGIGIPSEITPEQMFGSNINPSRKGTEGEKGTGIGLSICKKILDAHAFAITYQSTPNEGTDFIISL